MIGALRSQLAQDFLFPPSRVSGPAATATRAIALASKMALFSKEGMRRFKQGFLETIGVADNTREEDKDFERLVGRFNHAATKLGTIHTKLRDYIKTQEQLSLTSGAVYKSLTAMSSGLPPAAAASAVATSRAELAGNLKTCGNAQELHSQTIFNPSKKYFQRTVLRPVEVMAKKVTIIASLVTRCRGLYVDVDAFKHKFSSQKKKDPREQQPKTQQFRERLRSFTAELEAAKKQLVANVDRFEAEAKILVEHVLSAFLAYVWATGGLGFRPSTLRANASWYCGWTSLATAAMLTCARMLYV